MKKNLEQKSSMQVNATFKENSSRKKKSTLKGIINSFYSKLISANNLYRK